MTLPAPLQVSNLSVSYGAQAVIDGLTLPPLEPGQVTALVGPNGAGKSTVLKAIAQVLPSRGVVRLGDMDLRTIPALQRAATIGFMPQALPADTELTAIESIMVAVGGHAASIDMERQAVATMERIDILDLALRPLDRLSGGERQLVSLAQALAREPRVLFLDEPTSALDLARQYRVMRLLRSIASQGTIVVIVLHDLALAAHWADRMLVLRKGRLHAAGAPRETLTEAMLQSAYGVDASVREVDGRLFVMPRETA